MVAINRFRLINFVLDHSVGDEVLREIARRLLHWAPAQAQLAQTSTNRPPCAICGGSQQSFTFEQFHNSRCIQTANTPQEARTLE